MSAPSVVLFSIMEPLSGFEQFYPLPSLSIATIIVLPCNSLGMVLQCGWEAALGSTWSRQVEEPQTNELNAKQDGDYGASRACMPLRISRVPPVIELLEELQ